MAGLEPATRALNVRSNPSLRHLFFLILTLLSGLSKGKGRKAIFYYNTILFILVNALPASSIEKSTSNILSLQPAIR